MKIGKWLRDWWQLPPRRRAAVNALQKETARARQNAEDMRRVALELEERRRQMLDKASAILERDEPRAALKSTAGG